MNKEKFHNFCKEIHCEDAEDAALFVKTCWSMLDMDLVSLANSYVGEVNRFGIYPAEKSSLELEWSGVFTGEINF